MEYRIFKENLLYDGFLKIKKAIIIHDSFNDNPAIECEREMVDKGDFVAVLLYEKDTSQLLFIKQFRYPTIKNGNGWILEIPAGGIEKGEDPVECAMREVQEETGYQVSDLEHVITCYSTPGGSSERMFLYYTEVLEKDKIYEGGGVTEESEDIQLCKYPISEINTMLSKEIVDAKSIIALQWFKMNKLDN